MHICAISFSIRSRLIISDCMARARKKPPSDFRRASSTILEDTHISDRIMPGTGVSVFLDAGTGDLLKLAKNNIEKLKEKGKKVRDVYYVVVMVVVLVVIVQWWIELVKCLIYIISSSSVLARAATTTIIWIVLTL